ncbi:MAG: bacterial Ig-like domain-containing protein, partial [Candidatus Gallimonas sp.]
FVVSVSADCANWTDLMKNTVTDEFTARTANVPTDVLAGARTGVLYFRFGDSIPSDGFGLQLKSFRMDYTYVEGEHTLAGVTSLPFERIEITAPAKTEYRIGESLDLTGLTVQAFKGDNGTIVPVDYCGVKITSGGDLNSAGDKTVQVSYFGLTNTFSVTVKAEDADGGNITFTPNTEAETPYLYQEKASGTSTGNRWTDGDPHNAQVVYKFDKSALGVFASATLKLDITNEYKIEISLDGTTYTQVAIAEGRPARAEISLVLDEFLSGNTGVIYIRLSDAVVEDGFGGSWFGVTLEYTLS